VNRPAATALDPFARRRRWCSGLAIVVVVVAVVPPFATDARRYVFVEAIQFALVGLALPALAALAAPLSFLTSGWDATRLARTIARREEIRRTRKGFGRLVLLLVPYVGAFIAWRVPGSVDALATTPDLVVAEIATFTFVGVPFWVELVRSPPFPPLLSAAQHIVPAAIAMWMVWILAYFVGFSHTAWYPSVHASHRGGLGLVADQELSTGVLWFAGAATFLPVIFTNLMRFLRGEDEVQDEADKIVGGGASPTAS
jgi:cytochrome c oxidase assembly factor CtaG